jgi:hypothetical protein
LNLFQEWGEIKESNGSVNSSMIYLIHCKNLHKCHSVPLPSTTIKEKKQNKIKTKLRDNLNAEPLALN